VLGGIYLGVGAGRRLHSEELTILSKILPYVVIDNNAVADYMLPHEANQNTILVTVIGRGRPEAFHALGHKVIIAGRRQEVPDQTTDANPGIASVTLDERRSACLSL
jgi:hypothetical protein